MGKHEKAEAEKKRPMSADARRAAGELLAEQVKAKASQRKADGEAEEKKKKEKRHTTKKEDDDKEDFSDHMSRLLSGLRGMKHKTKQTRHHENKKNPQGFGEKKKKKKKKK